MTYHVHVVATDNLTHVETYDTTYPRQSLANDDAARWVADYDQGKLIELYIMLSEARDGSYAQRRKLWSLTRERPTIANALLATELPPADPQRPDP